MRPVDWVMYKNINGDQKSHSVWMNIIGITAASQLPIHKKFSLFAEAGLCIITRKGFEINGIPVVKHAIRNHTMNDCRKLANSVLKCKSGTEVRQILTEKRNELKLN